MWVMGTYHSRTDYLTTASPRIVWKMGPRKFQNHTMQIHYKYDSHSVVLSNLLYKTKPHYSEDRTMRGLAVCT